MCFSVRVLILSAFLVKDEVNIEIIEVFESCQRENYII